MQCVSQLKPPRCHSLTHRVVRLRGGGDHGTSSGHYKQYKIYATTSLFEGNPKSLLEAMSSGCVVVAPDNSNINEIIKHDWNGVLHSYDKREIGSAIEYILVNYSDFSNIIGNSRETIKRDFSISKIVEKEFDIYCKLSD